jgi:magnesium chelatase subunit I
MSSQPIQFPFSALQDQADLQTALLITAIDPRIGGILIQGPRGTAKSTSARAIAELLPDGELVNLPLGASEEQLIGSLDLEQALQQGSVRFRPGLLARAHEGVLYVDEVNLLADHLVDVLLDIAASGINYVERDGVSHQHDSRFVLIGTMNPEEGELRPQLLDRFGLFIDLSGQLDRQSRQRIVKARMAFDQNPTAFIESYAAHQDEYRERIREARTRLEALAYTDDIHDHVAGLCADAHIEGVRGDLVLLRAARAHAALNRKQQIDAEDVEQVADWVLRHRRKARPETTDPESSRIGERYSGEENSKSQSVTPPNQTAGRSDNKSQSSAANQGNDEWGALPPQTVPIKAVKSTHPISAKKW